MKNSTDRILTTHVGSLPRPENLLDLLEKQDKGESYNSDDLRAEVVKAVNEIVATQVENGIDIVSDGEMSKLSYTVYVKHRLGGLAEGTEELGAGKDGKALAPKDFQDHPGFMEWRVSLRDMPGTRFTPPRAVEPVSYGNTEPLEDDLANMKQAVTAAEPVDAFINTASPGVLPSFVRNGYYPDDDSYVAALADTMKTEYDAIHQAGFLVQIDCPDLAMTRHLAHQDKSDADFLKIAQRNVEAINHATRDIPAESMRMHICWGNYPGPHTHDVPVSKIVDIVMQGRPQALLFEGANPRHEHEWEDWAAAKIPDDKILVPGVIDSTNNFVEHPRLIAHRIKRYADIVGRERVIAGTDCGFSTVAGMIRVYPSVVWNKFRCLAEGAAIASKELWR